MPEWNPILAWPLWQDALMFETYTLRIHKGDLLIIKSIHICSGLHPKTWRKRRTQMSDTHTRLNVLQAFHPVWCIFKLCDPTTGFTVAIKPRPQSQRYATSWMFQVTWIQDAGGVTERWRAASKDLNREQLRSLLKWDDFSFCREGGRVCTVGDPPLRFISDVEQMFSTKSSIFDGATAGSCTAEMWADRTDWIIRRPTE